ncbi:hypothetical protein Drorol1_Dr00011660 [Drosera rotundifolia]
MATAATTISTAPRSRTSAAAPVLRSLSNSSYTSPGSLSPSLSISRSRSITTAAASNQSRRRSSCMCSPTSHPGSFRCSRHKNTKTIDHSSSAAVMPYRSKGLSARRSAMTNSLVRIGTVEGDLIRRALAASIRPSSQQQRRRLEFRARPSRLSVMSID